MKKIILVLGCLLFPILGYGSEIFQNFEVNNGSSYYASSPNNGLVDFGSGNHDGYGNGGNPVYSGNRSMCLMSWAYDATHYLTKNIYWCRLSVGPQGGDENFDLKPLENDRLTFRVFPMSHRNQYVYGWENGREDNVGVVFYDDGNYSSQGFEVWTTGTAPWGQWTELKILFSQLPEDMNLNGIRKIEFITYYPGTYYFDDLMSTRAEHVYQSFNPSLRTGTAESEYGWKWNDGDFAGLSAAGEPVKEGSNSWKIVTAGYWGGTGIQSQEKKYYNPGTAEQTFWHVNLDPDKNDRLIFWVYALPENGLENNLAVQFYDNDQHYTDDTKVVVWTKETARVGQWTRFSIPFSTLPASLNLRDINKIQFQFYFPGTYYIDEIKAINSIPLILKNNLDTGLVEWEPVEGNVKYRLEESLDSPEGGWRTVYYGTAFSYNCQRLVPSWYRVRAVEEQSSENPSVHCSEWSEVVSLTPSVSFNSSLLINGILSWQSMIQTDLFEVQSAESQEGPWTQVYLGTMPGTGISVESGLWYRVRAVFTNTDNQVVEATEWSALQTLPVNRGFLRAEGISVKDNSGNTIVLQGVNLGGSLITEKWMTGIGDGDAPVVEDEWTLRNILTERFGDEAGLALLRTYQESYLNEYDFDVLKQMGINLVRLPFYFRNLQNEAGEWIRDANGNIDFSPLDRIVKMASERGIYVLLDLHGAPGSQSLESHTGRKDYNRLFENSLEGEAYRVQTIELWKALAAHYKDEPMIAGYDLLNEPVGAPSSEVLKNLYNRLYQAVREIDANHMLVMEGIWDWDTLPVPASMNWTNVMYQFHFYYFGFDENVDAHKAYIDQKIADSQVKQASYNVPVMIGEFSAFSQKESWEYYLSQFKAQGWSWAPWNYKFHNPGSNWGFYCHAGYEGELPKFRALQSDGTAGDSYETLVEKLSSYDTKIHHTPNLALINCVKNNLVRNPEGTTFPFIDHLSRTSISPVGDFYIYGKNFGSSQGAGRVTYGGNNVCMISWSDEVIHVYLPTSEKRTSGLVQVITDNGTASNEKNLIMPSSRGGISSPSVIRGNAGDEVIITGTGFGDFTGEVTLSHTYVSNPGSILPVNRGQAAIHVWNDSEIRFTLPADAIQGATNLGLEYQPGRANSAPVLDSIGAKNVSEGQTLAFNVTASDSENDTLQYTAEGLPQGAVFENSTFTWVPTYAQAGTYTVVFNVSDGYLSDSETVTLGVANVPVPDLMMTALSPASLSVAPGSIFTLSNTVKNIGETGAGTFTIAFHLSQDNIFGGADDIDLGKVRSVSSLLAGKSSASSISLTVPSTAPLGTYYLCASADSGNTVTEGQESNNALCSSVLFSVAPADLTVKSMIVPKQGLTGANLNLSATVQNLGAGKVSSFNTGFYLSGDANITTADLRLAAISISTLEGNASGTVTAVVAIPPTLKPGVYYMGAVADYSNLRPESNENNNGLGISVTLAAGGDLVMNQVSAPSSCVRGQSIGVNNTVINQGQGAVSSFYVGIYLSRDSQITTADKRIATRYITSLKAGQSDAAVKTFNMPTVTPGTYYIGVIADYSNIRYEQNEQNNSLCGQKIVIS